MCGIAGIINYQNIDLKKLLLLLKHRGPDHQAIYTDHQIALLHTRLAIQDIQLGIQPFHFTHYSIIFNGEIYNHQALREHLKEFNFQTNSDTETLLYLFIKYREKMFDWLDGMFAFCIYDKKNRQLFLARDRAGKKPLYYHATSQNFIFASELNAIKAIKNLDIDEEAIQSYLRTGFFWKPYTAYQQVFKLTAGHYLTIDIDTLQQKSFCYFDLLSCYQQTSPLNFQDSLLETERRLQKSIADRISASDLEVGVFLSGGIDSNLIAAMSAQIKPKIKTFTVKFDGLYDESALAQLTADHYQTDHTELHINQPISQTIENILLAYGEPFMDSSAIPSYFVSQAARKHVTVILSGDGADELFAGYRRYVPVAYQLSTYAQWFKPLLALLPKAGKKQSIYNYLYRLLALSGKKGLDYYLSSTTDIFEDVLPIPHNAITANLDQWINHILSTTAFSSLKKMLYLDFSILLFCDLLVKMDIASMSHSLEVRSPFLSKYLLEFAPSLPDNFKINRWQTKFILRELAKKYLPPALIQQPKRGFEVPLQRWIQQDLRDNIHDRLIPGCYAENFVGKNFLQQLLAKKLDISAEKHAKIVWSLYCLEVWHHHETHHSIHRKLSTVIT